VSTALAVRSLRKSFGDVHAVADLDMSVATGECFGLLGPNGAGKTTTLEICEGLLEQDSGDVEILGMKWTGNKKTLRQRIGIALQETQLAEKLSVTETLQLFRSFYPSGREVAHVISLVQLEEKATARVGTLSGGQKQRLALACALVGDPQLLFLDEPTTGLDPQSRRQLWDLIERFKDEGKTVVITTHYMDEAERLCDRVAIVDHGKVIAVDTPPALIASLGGDQVVTFTLEEPQVELEHDDLRKIEGVTGVRRETNSYELTAKELRKTVPAVLAFLEKRGARLAELRTHSATLEDVFVNLTGRHLRDG
jgi:ABC-2 type transport system ATP-binding protein